MGWNRRSARTLGDIIHLRLTPIGYREEPRDGPDVEQMLINVLSALRDMHVNHWAHRDLKMANIIRCIDGAWMLIDLDLACKVDESWPFWARPSYPMPLRQSFWTPKQDIEQLGICVRNLKLMRSMDLTPVCGILHKAPNASLALENIITLNLL
jgi:serine/threonine protein kinase